MRELHYGSVTRSELIKDYEERRATWLRRADAARQEAGLSACSGCGKWLLSCEAVCVCLSPVASPEADCTCTVSTTPLPTEVQPDVVSPSIVQPPQVKARAEPRDIEVRAAELGVPLIPLLNLSPKSLRKAKKANAKRVAAFEMKGTEKHAKQKSKQRESMATLRTTRAIADVER